MSPDFAGATVADAILTDKSLGMRCHYAVKVGRMFYDGQAWTIRRQMYDEHLVLGIEPITWLRHWLTQGVVELEQDFRPRPGHDPSELVMDLILPCRLVFVGQWGDPGYAHDRNLWNCNCARTEKGTR